MLRLLLLSSSSKHKTTSTTTTSTIRLIINPLLQQINNNNATTNHNCTNKYTSLLQKHGFKTIDKQELLRLMEAPHHPCILIDVRPQEEIDTNGGTLQHGKVTAHTLPLPEIEHGAFTWDKQAFEKKFGFKKPHPSKDVVVLSCRSGRRSATAAVKMEEAGYQHVISYGGGALDWWKQQ
jgi:rhodanese-related sulfurtransferase